MFCIVFELCLHCVCIVFVPRWYKSTYLLCFAFSQCPVAPPEKESLLQSIVKWGQTLRKYQILLLFQWILRFSNNAYEGSQETLRFEENKSRVFAGSDIWGAFCICTKLRDHIWPLLINNLHYSSLLPVPSPPNPTDKLTFRDKLQNFVFALLFFDAMIPHKIAEHCWMIRRFSPKSDNLWVQLWSSSDI